VLHDGEKLEQLTDWGKPAERMMGVKRRPSYLVWLRIERRRLLTVPGRFARVIKNSEGMVSLWVNKRAD
jgi:hypothetical protein